MARSPRSPQAVALDLLRHVLTEAQQAIEHTTHLAGILGANHYLGDGKTVQEWRELYAQTADAARVAITWAEAHGRCRAPLESGVES